MGFILKNPVFYLFYLSPLYHTVLRDVVESEGPPDLLANRFSGEVEAKHELSIEAL